ncbi:hypothetical protein LOD99_14442 [Oopsacas minuta]|uniref:Uncharacterized protein n=1 Tax=Oopsacas minuta TaxID=111878 RepID=A0AAV7KE93_9METZ|nr:hypothetical protein LOD99_14442 [Oopsacas minuta]
MQNIIEFVNRAYHAYFKVKLGGQDKSWAPHKVCKSCVELLRYWSKGKEKHLPFGIPMIWRESKNHFDDCYFSMVNVMGYKKSDRYLLNYPNLESAIRPVPHCSDLPVPIFTEFLNTHRITHMGCIFVFRYLPIVHILSEFGYTILCQDPCMASSFTG